jgi:hypothetical protein
MTTNESERIRGDTDNIGLNYKHGSECAAGECESERTKENKIEIISEIECVSASVGVGWERDSDYAINYERK